MRQISRKRTTTGGKGSTAKKKLSDKRLPPHSKVKKERKHPDFGTSKAEQSFAKNFLDKLGVRYVWQFEMKEIGRWMDYFLPDYRIGIEFDGQYFHADERVYKKEDLNPMQKHNLRVDEQKDRWALLHGIPLLRIKEKDVNERPQEVMKTLRERLKIQGEIISKKKDMSKRHVNKLNENKVG